MAFLSIGAAEQERRHAGGGVEVWRGGLGRAYPLAGPFVCRCLTSPPVLRFHIPLIEPDVRVSRIRLSDKVLTLSPTEGPATARLSLRLGVQCRLRLLNLVGLIGTCQSPGSRHVLRWP